MTTETMRPKLKSNLIGTLDWPRNFVTKTPIERESINTLTPRKDKAHGYCAKGWGPKGSICRPLWAPWSALMLRTD